MKKIVLIDGNNLMFRSFYATMYSGKMMRSNKGIPTNALYGFTNMINKIIEEEKPSYMAVAFDIGKNFRHDKYKEYKDGRQATPAELKSQMPIAKQLLDKMGIKHLELEGYEADDIIGTLAEEANKDPEFDALVISSDRDLLQLISPVVSMKLLKAQGHIYYDVDSFKKDYGFEPIKIIDLKSLMGDASDNIPGVKGIGEKTALSLIQKYGSLDGVYEHLDELTPKTKEKLESDRENAYFSFELATIFREVPLDVNLEDLKYDGPNTVELIEMYRELGFHSFLRNLTSESSEKKLCKYKAVENISEISEADAYSYYIELSGENYHYEQIVGMSLSDGKNTYYIKPELVSEVLTKYKNRLKYTFNLKKNIIISSFYGIENLPVIFDLMIAYYLLNINSKDDLAIRMNEEGIDVYYLEDLYKNKPDSEKVKEGIASKAEYIWNNVEDIKAKLKSEEAYSLFVDIEMPLVEVLASMEREGIRVRKDVIAELKVKLKSEIDELKKEIWSEAGCEFNISSPKQVAEILFDKMEIPYPKKGSKRSTDNEILIKLVGDYKIVELILKYRTVMKIYGTYLEPLEEFVKEDGKIHTIYKQTLTRTGRLSSAYPNLQNIPSHEEEGRLVKKAFIAEDDSILLSADYSQIELRILASIAEDEVMINAFKNGEDIHRRVAADIYGIPLGEVSKEQRSTAKSVIFGIVYGISGFGLGENLNISSYKAKEFIDKYYEMYPKVKKYMEDIKSEAYDKGYVYTLLKRKRYIEELSNYSYMVRMQGERIALNTPIQGTGADIIKIAMVNLFRELKNRKFESKILLQVHDEIIMNVRLCEYEDVSKLVKSCMESALSLKVPLKVEISTGNDWYEAK